MGPGSHESPPGSCDETPTSIFCRWSGAAWGDHTLSLSGSGPDAYLYYHGSYRALDVAIDVWVDGFLTRIA
jgi:hypothetical protein